MTTDINPTFAIRGVDKPKLFLYDVTSSYLEGEPNYFGECGYNRDGKKGKKQIVIGLLCDEYGEPVSTEVFAGNTQDLHSRTTCKDVILSSLPSLSSSR